MMHVVQLANFYGPRSGGLRTALDRLAAGYVARGHRVTTIVPGASDETDETAGRTVIRIGSPVAPLLGGDYRMVIDRRTVDRVIAETRPDVIELSDKTTLVGPTIRWRARGVPVVLFSHERLDEVVSRATRVPASRRIVDRYNERLVGRVDAIVCASRYAASEFERLGVTAELVPLGVELDRFRPRPGRRRAVPEIVVTVRLSPEKSPGSVVDTSRALLRAGCQHRMVIHGDGPLRAQLERQATDLPIEFRGFVSDRDELAARMSTADVGIAPGPLETFGLAALELLASGTPVVVPDRGALAELVDGVSVVAAPGDGHHLAAAVMEVLAGDPHQQRTCARTLAERYCWDRTVDGMLAVFERAAGAMQTEWRDSVALGQGRSYL